LTLPIGRPLPLPIAQKLPFRFRPTPVANPASLNVSDGAQASRFLLHAIVEARGLWQRTAERRRFPVKALAPVVVDRALASLRFGMSIRPID
jgi:hypothetical protein